LEIANLCMLKVGENDIVVQLFRYSYVGISS
jgi:hypothetical protein